MAGSTQTILVVEDEQAIASFVAAYLRKDGFAVQMTASGREALSLVGSDPPSLVVLDLMLPDLDGIEVCRRIRETSTLPVLMLTARDDDLDKIAGLEVGADDYLTKPFNPREPVARVRAILRRSAGKTKPAAGAVPAGHRARGRRRDAHRRALLSEQHPYACGLGAAPRVRRDRPALRAEGRDRARPPQDPRARARRRQGVLGSCRAQGLPARRPAAGAPEQRRAP